MLPKWKKKGWWRESFVTLMLIPERTRRVHKVVIPFFFVKLALLVFSFAGIFLIIMGLDYIHVLGRIAENKALKGENFKLRQEIQTVRNKVDSMEVTIERVRNYAKKLQILTGQGAKGGSDLPWGPTDAPEQRTPSGKVDKHSRLLEFPVDEVEGNRSVLSEGPSLDSRVEKLEKVSGSTEEGLSHLHAYLLTRTAIMNATPSLLPIAGWISSPFGYRRNPYDGSYRLHAGVDIAAEPGTPVRSPADGTVIFSGYREGYGKAVVLDHGYGIRTLFAHNSKLFVAQGTRIKRGETISQVGSTGHSTGPHLHYEVRKNGVPVNPATFFSRSRF
jgi:murein DD-endopeptidase MepM/ murein hydrolase activator NlpD